MANDTFNLIKGLDSKIKAKEIVLGSLYFATDSQSIYLDAKTNKDGNVKRIHFTDVVDLSINSPAMYYPNKIYISADGNKLQKYNPTNNTLETISELESEILESNNEFVYDTNNPLKATLVDSSSPKKGTIVIDANGDIGIVTSINGNTLSISMIANNKLKNKLTNNDIYVDSNYNGFEVGNFDFPFNSWESLYKNCKSLLENDAYVTIHLKTNTVLTMNQNDNSSSNPIILRNVVINGGSNKSHILINMRELSMLCINSVFENITWDSYTSNPSVLSLNLRSNISNKYNVVINNCDCSHINVQVHDNCNITNSIFDTLHIFYNQTINNIKAYINNSDINSFSLHRSDAEFKNTTINCVELLNDVNTIIFDNTNITKFKDLVDVNYMKFIGGKFLGDILTLSHDNIYDINNKGVINNLELGTFDYSSCSATNIDNRINIISKTGLSSMQVYDDNKNREYEVPENESLKAHLDAIGKSIKSLDTKMSKIDGIDNAFVSKNTFKEINELNGEFKIGDVMTYVNESSQNLSFNFPITFNNYRIEEEYDFEKYKIISSLNYITDLNDKSETASKNDCYMILYNNQEEMKSINTIYQFDGMNWNTVEKSNYVYQMFTLENASYLAKFNDKINITIDENTLPFIIELSTIDRIWLQPIWQTVERITLSLPVFSITDNIITTKIKESDLLNNIDNTIESTCSYVFHDADGNIEVINFNENEEEKNKLINNIKNELLNLQSNYTFVQTIKVSYKDRLIRLSNGWDKLSGSSDNSSGNYHIVPKYASLNSIDNDTTREIGTLAFVQEDNVVYKWSITNKENGTKEWVEFSSGSGGSSNTSIELYSELLTQYSECKNLSFDILLKNVGQGKMIITYRFNADSNHTLSIDCSGSGVYPVNIPDSIEMGKLYVNVSYVNTDTNATNPKSLALPTLYIGNLLKIVNFELDKSIGIKSGNYVIDEKNVSNITFNGKNDVNLKMSFRINNETTSEYNYSIKLSQLSSYEPGTNTLKTHTINNDRTLIGSNNIDLLISNEVLQEKFGTNIWGYYNIKIEAVDSTGAISNTINYDFIIDSSITPQVIIIDSDDMTIKRTNYLKYLLLFNPDNLLDINQYSLMINIAGNNSNIEILNNPIELNSNNIYGTVAIDYDSLVDETNIYEFTDENQTWYKINATLFKDDLIASISNNIRVRFINSNTFQYVLDNRIFNLNSSKLNSNIFQSTWSSTDKLTNSHQLANDTMTLHNFSYSSNNGWKSVDGSDAGDYITTLQTDGYSTYCTIPINLCKNYSDTINKIDTSIGWTFELRYKCKELYTNGSVFECLNASNYGIKITSDRVIFSLDGDVDVITGLGSQMTMRLTSDEWHTLSFVMYPKKYANENIITDEYLKNMYNGQWISDEFSEVLFLYVDGVISGIKALTDTQAAAYKNNAAFENMIFGASFDYQNNIPTAYIKCNFSHVRLYNRALNPTEILQNYIADQFNEQKQIDLQLLNSYTNGQFGLNNTQLIELRMYGADLSIMDKLSQIESKNYKFPNVTLELRNNALPNPVLVKRYGCEVKVQGTSSALYMVKNYKITFYGYSEKEIHDKGWTITNNVLDDHHVFVPLDSNGDVRRDILGNIAYNQTDSERKGMYLDSEIKRMNKFDKVNYKKYGKEEISINGWLAEATYTLKADYMESTHCHNVGSAKLAHEFMPPVPPQLALSSGGIDNPYYGTTAEVTDLNGITSTVESYTKIRQSIDGFPILISYIYYPKKLQKDGITYDYVDPNDYDNNTTLLIEKGVYNFDIDKGSSNVFGYAEYGENCVSYEISGNPSSATNQGGLFDVNMLYCLTEEDKRAAEEGIQSDIEIRYHYDEDNALYINNDGSEVLKITCPEYIDILPTNITNISRNTDGTIQEVTLIDGTTYHEFTKIEISDDSYFNIANIEEILIDNELSKIRIYKDSIDINAPLCHLMMWMQDIIRNNRPTTRDEIIKHFNISNIADYILIVEVLGMSDNLAKNMMITTWNAATEKIYYKSNSADDYIHVDYDKSKFAIWYLQFYDLDTELGVSNDASQIYDTSIDVYGHSMIKDNINTIQTLENNLILDGNLRQYLTDIETVSYTGSASKLWEVMYNYFGKTSINYTSADAYIFQTEYNNLRSNKNMNIDTVFSFFNDGVINKIGQYYYNNDMLIKYLGKSFTNTTIKDRYFYMCKGSSCSHIKNWLTHRLHYIDSKYKYHQYMFTQRPVGENSALLNVKVNSPVYIYGQITETNTNSEKHSINQLCSSIDTNVIKFDFGNDNTFTLYDMSRIIYLTGLNAFNFNTIDLSQAINLINLSIAGSLNTGTLNLGSKILQKLNVSNSALTNLEISDCDEMIDLDISNTSITNMVLPINLKKLNIIDSRLSSLNMMNLNSLESFNTVNFYASDNYGDWTTYTKLLTNLYNYKLISTNNENDLTTADKQYLETLYVNLIEKLNTEMIDGLTYTTQLYNYMNNNITNGTANESTYENISNILKLIYTTYSYTSANTGGVINVNFSSVLKKVYIPGLAILRLRSIKTGTTTKPSTINSLSINSEYIKAIDFVADTENYIGTNSGNIFINCPNAKYIKINGINTQSTSKINLLGCENTQYLEISNSVMGGLLDISTMSKLQTIRIISSNNVSYKFSGIIISPELRTSNTLTQINFYNSYYVSTLIDSNEYAQADFVEGVMNLDGFSLTALNLYNVLYFTEIKNMNLSLNVAPRVSSDNQYTSFIVSSDSYVKILINYNRDAKFTSSRLTLSTDLSLESLFQGRINLSFNANVNNSLNNSNIDGLIINNLDRVKSLKNTFRACAKMTYNYVKYVLNNIDNTCTSLESTFADCFGLLQTFPKINGDNGVIGMGKYVVPNTLFGSNCAGITTISCLFANCGADSWTNLTIRDDLKLNENHNTGLYLAYGIFDNLVKCTNINKTFNSSARLYSSSNNSNMGTSQTTYRSNGTEISNNIYWYASYVQSFHVNIFDNLGKNSSSAVNIGITTTSVTLADYNTYNIPSDIGTFFVVIDNEAIQYCFNDNNRDSVSNMRTEFNTIFVKLNINANQFAGLFSSGHNIRNATLSGTTNSNCPKGTTVSSYASVIIDNRLFAKYNNNTLTTRNYASNLSFAYMFATFNSRTQKLKVIINNLFNYINTTSNSYKITLLGMFKNYAFIENRYKFELSSDMFNTTSDSNKGSDFKDKVSSTQQLFYNCTNVYGDFYNKEIATDADSGTNFYLRDINNTTILFDNIPNVADTSYMFYNTTNAFGLDYKTLNANNKYVSVNYDDIPIDIFHKLRNVYNIAYMFAYTNNNTSNPIKINLNNYTDYPFKNCKKLLYAYGLFKNITKLTGNIPSYGCKGSTINDVAYFYYDVSDSIRQWVITHIIDNSLSNNFYILNYENISQEDEVVVENGVLMYHSDNGDSKKITIDNLDFYINYTNVINNVLFNQKFTLLHRINIENPIDLKLYKYYQYYKTVSIDTLNDGLCTYCGTGIYGNELNGKYNSFIKIDGFFKTPNNSILGISEFFSGCSGLMGEIPANIFINVPNVTTLQGVFSNCSNIGLTETFTSDKARNPNNNLGGSGNASDESSGVIYVKPPYIIPYGIFDDLSELNYTTDLFKNILYLSKSYVNLSYNRSSNPPVSDTYGAQYGEIYALPKYLFRFNTKLINTSSMFYSTDSVNNLYGLLNPNMFSTNVRLTDISHMFQNTCIKGCYEISNNNIYNSDNIITPATYIGNTLFYNLLSLENISYFIYNCYNIPWLINPVVINSDDVSGAMLFEANRFTNRALKTNNFFRVNETDIGQSYGPSTNTFNNTALGKLVQSPNSTSFSSTMQLYDYFSAANTSDRMEKYIQS